MALRAVDDHPKMHHLKMLLNCGRMEALGALEGMWHFGGRFTPQGDIGKYTDAQIESWMEWRGQAGALVAALVESKWIDPHPIHRLLIHDWHEHADDATRIALKRKGLSFLTKLSGQCRDSVGTVIENAATTSGLPEPVPEPVPENISKANAFSPRQSAPRGDGGDETLEGSRSDYDDSQATTPAGKSNQSNVRAKVNGNLGASERECEGIYREYPRRIGKRGAIKTIQLAVKRVLSGKEIQGYATSSDAVAYLTNRVCAYARSPAGSNADMTKIPHPATWFNQSRYLDDDEAWQHVFGERDWLNRNNGPPPEPGIYRPK